MCPIIERTVLIEHVRYSLSHVFDVGLDHSIQRLDVGCGTKLHRFADDSLDMLLYRLVPRGFIF